MMELIEKLNYEIPAVRLVDIRLEGCFLQSGGDGEIDPGADDPWGDF